MGRNIYLDVIVLDGLREHEVSFFHGICGVGVHFRVRVGGASVGLAGRYSGLGLLPERCLHVLKLDIDLAARVDAMVHKGSYF